MKRNFVTWMCILLAWEMAGFMFTIIGTAYFRTMVGLSGVGVQQQSNEFFIYAQSHLPFLEGALFGFFYGNLFYVIYWLTENTRLRNLSFGRIILIQSILYILAFAVVSVLIFFSMSKVEIFPVDDTDAFFWLLRENPSLLIAFLIYIPVVIIIVNFFLEVSKKFGPGNLWNLFIGKYHTPIVEDKIFMFLDLKDSTGYAEKLGHIKYSRLIQSCFQDLNTIVSKHNAQIYQYVGDEAVLMWDKNENGAASDCIQLYYAFRALLLKKSDKYESRYGFVPEFKAGINQGTVTAAEVGNIKREIAFHGDVLNTAARIQKVCNQYKKDLLASESFAELILEVEAYRKVLIGYIPLKGKSIPVNVYSIELA
ncbi:MAG: adenylate/guanylate cyclase domain-containing protein [Cyclobacteriaceae bacterium]